MGNVVNGTIFPTLSGCCAHARGMHRRWSAKSRRHCFFDDTDARDFDLVWWQLVTRVWKIDENFGKINLRFLLQKFCENHWVVVRVFCERGWMNGMGESYVIPPRSSLQLLLVECDARGLRWPIITWELLGDDVYTCSGWRSSSWAVNKTANNFTVNLRNSFVRDIVCCKITIVTVLHQFIGKPGNFFKLIIKKMNASLIYNSRG